MLASESDLTVVAEATNGLEALELCRLHRPDLVLMDVRMPKLDGLGATRAIKEECPQTSVLMVTSHEDPGYLLEAVRAGAAGYVLKEAPRQQLLSALRRVLQGDSPLNQELAMRLLRQVAAEENVRRQEETASAPEATANNGHQRSPPESLTGLLSPREFEVLRLIVAGRTNRQIAQDRLLGYSTVKGHVQRMIAKLGVSDRTQAAVRATGSGLLPEQSGK